ncbi:polyamine-transporting ATPase 13A3 [Nematostella vectensis]|uniref:polyamine-transporting ATPase 13A3 n=1 Tax=Nematostella vectensis TaxID=45351 RepID=UPI00138FCAE9|nr:polyamine-transporting ATPase 13A3 [Nematostella vectensis]
MPNEHKGIIITDDDGEQLVCYGYSTNTFKLLLFYMLVLCSGGFLILICYWKPEWKLKLICTQCHCCRADYVLLKSSYNFWSVEDVVHEKIPKNGTSMAYESNDCIIDVTSNEKQNLLSNQNGRQPYSVMVYFIYRHLKYVWNFSNGKFEILRGLDENTTVSGIFEHAPGLQSEEAINRLSIYGSNIIDVKVKSYGRLFLEEALDPFYIFQVASVCLWLNDNYYYYAVAISIISIGSICISVHQTKKHLMSLRNMVAQTDIVTILRNNGVTEEIQSTDLVPGDVIVIPAQGATMHCDAALISGNCIVNESMLTGESVPVTKTPLPSHTSSKNPDESHEFKDEIYSLVGHKRHTLFNGTKVIQTRYYGHAKVLAVVICTGFSTTKGGLIRSILNPRPVGFKFFRDSMRFIGFLGILACTGFSYSVYVFIKQGATVGNIIKKALDVITIAVPPALPAAMSVGTVYAVQRLKKQQIYCINPSRINMCGKLKLFCFDKTGTLTEDGLDLLGVVPIDKGRFSFMVADATALPKCPLLAALATCHSLTVIDGEITGDPLDLKMFEATDWILNEPGEDTTKFDTIIPTTVKPRRIDEYREEFTVEDALEGKTPYEIAIVRQFPFSSDVQRMSVITRTLGANHMDVYAKGAPETIAALCRPESVPLNFQEELNIYTKQGFRVLGLAWRPMKKKFSWVQAQRVKRDVIESDLTFVGLLIMQNALKEESTPVIHRLQEASIRTVMVTGDNMLTAVSVARECGMVGKQDKVILVDAKLSDDLANMQLNLEVMGEVHTDSPTASIELPSHRSRRRYHMATSGKTFARIRENDPDLLKKLLVCGTVFARMSPEQKTHLVEELQGIGYCVGMCGDGANDCGALKTAHAGISLSEAEASVASPFTSKIPNIECVPKVIKEGRCALVTSFACFKYMAMYSIVQFVSVLILYSIHSNLADFQFLYIDLVVITSLALVMGNQHPFPYLVSQRPGGSLVAPIVLFSLLSQIVTQIAFQVVGFLWVRQQSWFVPVNVTSVKNTKDQVQYACHENSVLFAISSFQYILLAVAFSRGKPYRLPIYRNLSFMLVLVVLTAFTLFLVIYGHENKLHTFFKLKILPDFYFRLYLVALAVGNLIISLLIEDCLVPSRSLGFLLNKLRRKHQPKNRYKILQQEIDGDAYWPPVSLPS